MRPSSQHRRESVAGASRLPRCWRPAGARPSAPPAAERQRVDPGTGVGQIARLEAALWLADGALPAAKLARAAGLESAAECRELIEAARRRLRARRSALEIVEVAGGYRLVTRSCFAPWIDRLAARPGGSPGEHLGRAAAETLAVVAYRQPVVRAEVEAIRGVACGDPLRQLLESGLLRIVGRSKELGRPLLYGTTDRFLERYGLGSLTGLPSRDEPSQPAGPTTTSAANTGAA